MQNNLIQKQTNMKNPLFDQISKNHNVNLLESDQDAIKRICRAKFDGDNNVVLRELDYYLMSQHDLYLLRPHLAQIVELCREIESQDPDPEPLKFQRPMTKEVLIAIIEDSRAHVLRKPKYFRHDLKSYLYLKRKQRNYRKRAFAK